MWSVLNRISCSRRGIIGSDIFCWKQLEAISWGPAGQVKLQYGLSAVNSYFEHQNMKSNEGKNSGNIILQSTHIL
jgi:hypothetical protein